MEFVHCQFLRVWGVQSRRVHKHRELRPVVDPDLLVFFEDGDALADFSPGLENGRIVCGVGVGESFKAQAVTMR